jgi:hypothetical protein
MLVNLHFRRFLLAWRNHGHQDQLNAYVFNYADDFVICCRPDNAELAKTRMKALNFGLSVDLFFDRRGFFARYILQPVTSPLPPPPVRRWPEASQLLPARSHEIASAAEELVERAKPFKWWPLRKLSACFDKAGDPLRGRDAHDRR